MEWEQYKNAFLIEANKNNKSTQYCEKWLNYARKLFENNLPIIYNQEHLCMLVGYETEYIYAASNGARHFYRTFYVPKKKGGYRTISEPLPNLKDIQKWILINVLEKMEISPYAKAYVKGKNIRENARFHKRQKKVLSLDVHDFFGSISSFLVYEVFVNVGYQSDVAMMLTQLCCLEGSLPQGAPTSALLSNIIMKHFDDDIAKYVNENKIRYTRYADDMTFSGDFNEREMIRFVRKKLKKMGMALSEEKTRVRCQGQQQEVTGIVVNDKLQLSKKKRKKIRQEIYFIKKYGLQSHLEYIQEERRNYLEHIKGEIAYAFFINPKDAEMKEYLEYIKTLKD